MFRLHVLVLASCRYSVEAGECTLDGVVCCFTTYSGARNFYNKEAQKCETVLKQADCSLNEELDRSKNTCMDLSAAFAAAAARHSTTTTTTTQMISVGSGLQGSPGNTSASDVDCGEHGSPNTEEPLGCKCDTGWVSNVMADMPCAIQKVVQNTQLATAVDDYDSTSANPIDQLTSRGLPFMALVIGLFLCASCVCFRCWRKRRRRLAEKRARTLEVNVSGHVDPSGYGAPQKKAMDQPPTQSPTNASLFGPSCGQVVQNPFGQYPQVCVQGQNPQVGLQGTAVPYGGVYNYASNQDALAAAQAVNMGLYQQAQYQATHMEQQLPNLFTNAGYSGVPSAGPYYDAAAYPAYAEGRVEAVPSQPTCMQGTSPDPYYGHLPSGAGHAQPVCIKFQSPQMNPHSPYANGALVYRPCEEPDLPRVNVHQVVGQGQQQPRRQDDPRANGAACFEFGLIREAQLLPSKKYDESRGGGHDELTPGREVRYGRENPMQDQRVAFEGGRPLKQRHHRADGGRLEEPQAIRPEEPGTGRYFASANRFEEQRPRQEHLGTGRSVPMRPGSPHKKPPNEGLDLSKVQLQSNVRHQVDTRGAARQRLPFTPTHAQPSPKHKSAPKQAMQDEIVKPQAKARIEHRADPQQAAKIPRPRTPNPFGEPLKKGRMVKGPRGEWVQA